MIALSVAVAGVALVVALASLARAFSVSSSSSGAELEPYDDAELQERTRSLHAGLQALAEEFDEFRTDVITAVDEGIRDVKRRENRVRATVRRAREELDEGGVRHPGLEAEADDLQLEHEGGSRPSGVPAVQPGVVSGFDATGLPGSWNPQHWS